MLKKFIQSALLLVVLCTTATTYAQIGQSPEGIQFQALATDANGHPAAGRVIYVKDAIVAKTATGTIVYSETFKVTASSAGIFTIVLGKGTYASGVSSIANIDWANGPFFLNLKIAVEPTIPNAGWNVNNEYVDLGTSQFWSVPYALYAGNVKGADGKLNTSDTAAMLKPYFTAINLKANIESPTFTGTVSGITKAMVGLGNVDNTADLNKPVSTATQTALDLKANTASLALVATSGNYNDLLNKPSIPVPFNLTTASASVLGGVKIGSNLTIDGNGVLSANSSNDASSISGVVPIAKGGTSQTSLPGIKSMLGLLSNNVAIGNEAGTPNQGDNAGTIAIGGGAGRGNQGASSIAIGYVSGDQNQGANSISIGGNAAQSGQGTQAVAIGFAAGQNGQGANAVAIGTFAGQSGQSANSIAINATGTSTPLNPTNAGFYVDPIRSATATSSLLFYNPTSKELTTASANGSFVDLSTNQSIAGIKTFSSNIGIGNTNPTEMLDVTGNFKTTGLLKVGTVTYPNAHNSTAGQVLTTDASGVASWTTPASGGTALTMGSISGTSTANGASITDGVLNLAPANASNGGIVTAGAQSFGGAKTFSADLVVNGITVGKGNTEVLNDPNDIETPNYTNTAIGFQVLKDNFDGDRNTGVGYKTLSVNVEGGSNTAIGYEALRDNDEASKNTAVGSRALQQTKYGSSNGGYENTAIGSDALNANITGKQNTALGANSGTSGTNQAILINTTAVGYNAKVTENNTIQLGNTAITNVKTRGTLTAGAVTYPNTDGLNGQVLTTSGTGTLTWTTPPPTYAIGDTFAGGIVFYVYDGGRHGLIANTFDQTTNPIAWSLGGATDISTGARADGIGAGFKNTTIIIGKYGGSADPLDAYAATVCNEFVNPYEGYISDWYLPSIYELNLLFDQSAVVGLTNGATYWSSTEFPGTRADNKSKTSAYSCAASGDYLESLKSSLFRVRAIRSF